MQLPFIAFHRDHSEMLSVKDSLLAVDAALCVASEQLALRVAAASCSSAQRPRSIRLTSQETQTNLQFFRDVFARVSEHEDWFADEEVNDVSPVIQACTICQQWSVILIGNTRSTCSWVYRLIRDGAMQGLNERITWLSRVTVMSTDQSLQGNLLSEKIDALRLPNSYQMLAIIFDCSSGSFRTDDLALATKCVGTQRRNPVLAILTNVPSSNFREVALDALRGELFSATGIECVFLNETCDAADSQRALHKAIILVAQNDAVTSVLLQPTSKRCTVVTLDKQRTSS